MTGLSTRWRQRNPNRINVARKRLERSSWNSRDTRPIRRFNSVESFSADVYDVIVPVNAYFTLAKTGKTSRQQNVVNSWKSIRRLQRSPANFATFTLSVRKSAVVLQRSVCPPFAGARAYKFETEKETSARVCAAEKKGAGVLPQYEAAQAFWIRIK